MKTSIGMPVITKNQQTQIVYFSEKKQVFLIETKKHHTPPVDFDPFIVSTPNRFLNFLTSIESYCRLHKNKITLSQLYTQLEVYLQKQYAPTPTEILVQYNQVLNPQT